MRVLVIQWLIWLLLLTPLVALLLVLLGLVLLKRRSGLSPRLARLAVPPPYLVSLPIATLIAGAEMLALYFLHVLTLSLYGYSWSEIFVRLLTNVMILVPVAWFLISSPDHLFAPDLFVALITPVVFGSLIGFWVATFVSGYLLWQTVWREDHRQPSLRPVRQRLRGLLLLIAFAWAYIYLVTYIGTQMSPFGPLFPR